MQKMCGVGGGALWLSMDASGLGDVRSNTRTMQNKFFSVWKWAFLAYGDVCILFPFLVTAVWTCRCQNQYHNLMSVFGMCQRGLAGVVFCKPGVCDDSNSSACIIRRGIDIASSWTSMLPFVTIKHILGNLSDNLWCDTFDHIDWLAPWVLKSQIAAANLNESKPL